MNNSLVSIIVPCYNQAHFLNETLQSVLDQTYSNWECIVINDGSTDDTGKVVEKWITLDKRFNYLEHKNQGVSVARNLGIKNANGVYILPLDADDKISFDYLEIAIEAFFQNSSLKLVYCRAEKFGEETGEWHLTQFTLHSLAQENIIFSSAIFKKQDWKNVGGYDKNMLLGLEDWDFWISILKKGGEVFRIDKVCFFYRIKSNSRNHSLTVKDFAGIYQYISHKHYEFFTEHLGSSISLNKRIKSLEQTHKEKLKSKKFVLRLFIKTFFNFFFLKKNKFRGRN